MQQSTNQRNINKLQGRTKQPHHCFAGLTKGQRTTRQSLPCKAARVPATLARHCAVTVVAVHVTGAT
jgi:hypothetical protein